MNNFNSVDKGLPVDDDKALCLEVKTSDEDLKQFDEDGGMVYATFFDGRFNGVALDECGFVCLGMPLSGVTHWKYV